MPLEDVCSVEALLSGRAGARTKTTHHRSLVVSQSVSVLVILTSEALEVVLACDDGAFFRSLRLVRQQVRFQVFEDTTTLGKRAAPFLPALLVNLNITGNWTLLRPA